MVKKALVLMAVLAAMLAAAVPAAFAQEQVSAAGVLRAGLPADVGGNGTHSITDDATGELYALRGADLDAYVGQQVTVYGTLTPGEAGSGEPGFEGNGTLPSIDVTRVEPADGLPTPPEETPARYVTFTFELAVDGEPPAGAAFAGQIIGEGATYAPLTDPDGDGTYTGSERLPFGPFAPGVDVERALEAIRPSVAIAQGVETEEGFLPSNLIEDFGLQRLDGDKTFNASVAFDGGGEPPFRPVYTAVGVLEEYGPESRDPTPTYSITDEETGASYQLFGGFADLEPFLGERVLIYGVPLPGLPGPGGVPRGLQVTEVVPLGDSGEVVTVTFELAVDGEVPEGRTLAMRLRDGGPPSRFYEGPAGEVTFCVTDGNPNLPACENGGAYSGTLQVPAGEPIAFDYVSLGNGGETFYSDTRTFDEDDTVSVIYDAESEDGGGTTTPGSREPSGSGGSGSNGGSGGSGGSSSGTDGGGSGSESSAGGGSSGGGGSSTGGSSGSSGGSGGGILGSAASGARGLLPSTGGTTLAVLGAGVLLILAGLLVRRIFR